jgi:hypothetical protein
MKQKKLYREGYIYKDEEITHEEDIYSENSVNDLVEWDEISDEEAGFMMGYIEEEE